MINIWIWITSILLVIFNIALSIILFKKMVSVIIDYIDKRLFDLDIKIIELECKLNNNIEKNYYEHEYFRSNDYGIERKIDLIYKRSNNNYKTYEFSEEHIKNRDKIKSLEDLEIKGNNS